MHQLLHTTKINASFLTDNERLKWRVWSQIQARICVCGWKGGFGGIGMDHDSSVYFKSVKSLSSELWFVLFYQNPQSVAHWQLRNIGKFVFF